MGKRLSQLRWYLPAVFLLTAVVIWNLFEYSRSSYSPSRTVSDAPPPHASPALPTVLNITQKDLPAFDPDRFWKSFEKVQIEWDQDVIESVSIPNELKALDGQMIILKSITFLTKDGLVRTSDGCKVCKSVLVPPYGVIFCCNTTPVPRYEWTIVVNSSKNPWIITGNVPNEVVTIVKGQFRIATGDFQKGIFFIDDAEVTPCLEEMPDDDENICL